MAEDLDADLQSLRIARVESPPRRLPRWPLVVLVCGGGVYAAKTWGAPYVEARVFKTEIEVTEILSVSSAQSSVDLTATGYVVPQVSAKVGAKVVGRVAKVNIHEGDPVKAGDVLFVLDQIDQKSAIASAQAKVASAHARAVAAKAKGQVARANVKETKVQLDRQKKLVESGAATGSTAEDLDTRLSSLTELVSSADGDTAAAEAEAVAAQAEVHALQVGLESYTIASPLDGTAVTKPASVGDVTSPTLELIELVDFGSLLIEVDVPESRLGQVKAKAPCEVVLDAYPDKRLRGEVVDVSPRLNRAKATGTVKVRLVDKVASVLPEMAARVSFLQKALDAEALKAPPKKVIPSAAVVDRGGGKVAFVYEDGRIRMVTIRVGAEMSGGFELLDGPAAGTRLVKSPATTLVDGQVVKQKGSES
ncbi:MAG: efflux RND transporter periplasmic adaptor subunit [Polyangiales bacterium]